MELLKKWLENDPLHNELREKRDKMVKTELMELMGFIQIINLQKALPKVKCHQLTNKVLILVVIEAINGP
uniref:Uncharacterized protein n=1 Tax=virus sp. ctrcb4 TaxID=2825824 RepID=A0A8S5RPP3_9VIRU|nr:MAG TPA: hypothetical protein [virus sp. ctrcb4]